MNSLLFVAVDVNRTLPERQEKEGAATQAVATATDFGGEQHTFLKSAKLNAACFGDGGIQQTPISSFLLNGKDYAALAAETLQDVAKEWHKKQSRNTTTIKLGEYMVSVSSIRVRLWLLQLWFV